jgi:hypothetical protein
MNEVRKVYGAYREGGIQRVVAGAQRRFRERTRLWTRWGPLADCLASAFEPLSPAVLVLSLPRSGSSWVGSILGGASNGLYLREPITQGAAKRGTPLVPTADFDIKRPPSLCVHLGDQAFAGRPSFPRRIAQNPAQWSLLERRSRRVVVKEVNAPACGWYLERYRPRVVYLVRHPVAVALSFARQGWNRLQCCDDWQGHGHLQGRLLASVVEALRGYDRVRFIQYEELCRRPVLGFRALYEFGDLTWDAKAEQLVHEMTTGGDPAEPWIVARDSAAKADQWRSSCTQGDADCLRAAFRTYDLPWYTDDADWSVFGRKTTDADV